VYAIIDIETSGGNHKNGKITEVAIYKHDGKRIVEEYTTLINPGIKIDWYVKKLTGITDEMVSTAPKFHEVAKNIVEITRGCIFIAHNVDFDYGFIREEYKKLGYRYERKQLCTVKLSRKLLPDKKSYSLGKLCKEIGIELEDRHRASGDALATVKLFELLLEADNGKKLIPRPVIDPNQTSLF
jgi:DNA polymerase-3 subunit epsilon